MTTIAWDGKTVAADSLSTFDSRIGYVDVIKIRTRGPFVFALAGRHCLFEALMCWVEAGAIAAELPVGCNDEAKNDWALLVFERKRARLFTALCPYATVIEAPFAMGSGGDYAMGAMRGCDQSAREAVRAAMMCDVWSGGSVNAIDLAKYFESQDQKFKVTHAAE